MLLLFELGALLLVLTALFGWLNHVVLRLPHTIGLLLMGLCASLALVGLELAVPSKTFYEDLRSVLAQVDFRDAVLNGLLGFLLFAGALHVDLLLLRQRAWAVGAMASLGVVISTGLIGAGLWWLSGLVGVPVPFAWSLVFGALISPTDPVAVLSTLKVVKVPETLELDMAGESLFNDGVGVVAFAVLVAVAAAGEAASAGGIARLFSSSRRWAGPRWDCLRATSPTGLCGASTTTRSRRSSRSRW